MASRESWIPQNQEKLPPMIGFFSPWLCSRGPSRLGEWAYYNIIFTPSLEELGALAPLVRRLWLTGFFLLGAPWLLAWWGWRIFLGMYAFFVVRNQTFELDFPLVLQRVRPTSVLHIGANVASEAPAYAAAGVRRVIWIEAQSALEAPLRAAVEAAQVGLPPMPLGSGSEVLMAAVSNQSGQNIRLTLTNNSISTSLLPIGRGHAKYMPFIKALHDDNSAITVETVTVSDLLRRRRINARGIDFAYLDVQGAELQVLQGCGDALLAGLRAILTEVSTEEHYQGGCTMDELDGFLGARGFSRTLTRVPPIGHGNALYERHETPASDKLHKRPQLAEHKLA